MYYVIGGRHTPVCYGCTLSKKKAIRIAHNNREHWEGVFGWYIPQIYFGDNVEIVTIDGKEHIAPKVNALPCVRT